MCTWESRRVVVVFGPGRSFWCPSVYTGGSLVHAAATPWWRTYGRRIVFKTAGGSQALEPSCDLVLPQRAGPIALRLEAEFQYTRIFNERPTPSSSPPLPAHFRSRILFFFFFFCFFHFVFVFFLFLFPASPAYSSDAFSSFAPMCSFFRWVSSGSPDIPGGELVRQSQNRLFVFPRHEREDREDTSRLWDWNREFIVS